MEIFCQKANAFVCMNTMTASDLLSREYSTKRYALSQNGTEIQIIEMVLFLYNINKHKNPYSKMNINNG